MPRTARTIIGGYCYHLINRGNNQARIFHDYADYAAFLALLAETQQCVIVPILAACLMPNHLHLVVRPAGDGDLARWTQRLFTTHVRRHHRKYETSGRLWQGRFKAFLIQEDHHLVTVMRYVERNALRAGLVARAEDWRWGSLRWRTMQSKGKIDLAKPPVALPDSWVTYVNEAQTAAELESIRTCIQRQRPFGADRWVEDQASDLGLLHTLAPLGRPRRCRANVK
jgi:putative transposase